MRKAAAISVVALVVIFAGATGVASLAKSLTNPGSGSGSCRGAAAMLDPGRCATRSPAVTPNPSSEPSSLRGPARNRQYCRGGLKTNRGLPQVCSLGVPAAKAKRQIAVVGDSHAAQWRPALDRVGRQRGWNLLSTTASECDFGGPTSPSRSCAAWQKAVVRWLERHRGIDTVIVGQVAKRDRKAPARYRRAWEKLPPSVERILVLRDTPVARPEVRSCVSNAVSQRRSPGAACATLRSEALRKDGAVLAAKSVGTPRAHAIDMSRFFCNSRRCFPVIGGVLVYADGSHMTPRFNLTLAPYLGSELSRAIED